MEVKVVCPCLLRKRANLHRSSSQWLIATPLMCSTVNDIIATSFLCMTLQRSKTGITLTDGVLNGFIALALNTGLLISCVPVSSLVIGTLKDIEKRLVCHCHSPSRDEPSSAVVHQPIHRYHTSCVLSLMYNIY